MTPLKVAIASYDRGWREPKQMEPILYAARQVANLDYSAAFAVWWKNDHITNDQERLTLAVNAALGVMGAQ